MEPRVVVRPSSVSPVRTFHYRYFEAHFIAHKSLETSSYIGPTLVRGEGDTQRKQTPTVDLRCQGPRERNVVTTLTGIAGGVCFRCTA